jgi:Flp pilus assembly secretin CpaC
MTLPFKTSLVSLLAAVIAAGLIGQAFAADLNVTVDEAKLVPLRGAAAEIILGNPMVADVAVQNSRLIVVTGKSFGRTNLLVLDSNGKEILNTSVSVATTGRGIVTLHKGSSSLTFYCAPNCGSALAVGDAPDYFENVSKEIQVKQSMSRGAAEGGDPE